MKKSSDDLYRLIHALDKQEKRYFKVFAKKHIKDSSQHYIRLFDTINAEKKFDEEQFKIKHRKEPFVKHLPSNKNYLYQLILDSLASYHGSASTETVLNNMLRHVEILYGKGLFRQCWKSLKKAKALAEKHEKHVYVLVIMDWEQRLMAVETYAGMNRDSIDRHHSDYDSVIERVANINYYRRASAHTVSYFVKKGGIRNKEEENYLEDVIINEEFMDENNAIAFQSKIYQFHSLGFYYMNKGDMPNAFRYNLKLVQLLEDNEGKIQERVTNYISSLNNFLICCLRLKRYREFREALEKLRSLPRQYPDAVGKLASVSIIIRVWIFEQEYYIYRGEFRKGMELAGEIAQKFPEQEENIKHPGQWISLHYNMVYLYFGAGRFKESLEWSNKVLNNRKIDAGEDMYSFCTILNILIHYELGNTDLMPYLIRSARNFFKSAKRLYRFEKSMLDFLDKKLIHASSKKDRTRLCGDQVKVLEHIARDDPYEHKALGYFDFISWLESKVTGKSFEHIVQKKQDVNS